MSLRSWSPRQWLVAAGAAVLAAVLIGVPTGVVPSAFYSRMTPVLWWNYPVWAVSSVLMGLLAGTYAGGAGPATGRDRPRGARALAAGVLSVLAVGCPVCNKLVVLALGMSGAMSYWAPAQPLLAVASVALLAHALVKRLRTASACPVPAPATGEPDALELPGKHEAPREQPTADSSTAPPAPRGPR
ncbi:hypothetical protein ABZ714_27150 [Streptomyces sp. NPDC006798]|uniref:hypothetical protein n=1 Tax=Streptomyces sp. NPDC006798 TaxID=3155462 RepID=UPI0033C22265